MLGRVRRTSRLDVGLALSFGGLSFLVWALVAGVSRAMMRALPAGGPAGKAWPEATRWAVALFREGGFVIDVVGLAWMALSLFLVVQASKQRISVSWAWLSAVTQAMLAAVGGALAGWAAMLPTASGAAEPGGALAEFSQLSLPMILGAAVTLWVVALVFLLLERARFIRRGPTLSDGLRTNR